MNIFNVLFLRKYGGTGNYFETLFAKKSGGGGGGVPDGYRELIGFEFSANTYFEITDFKLCGSDTIRFSWSADKACNVFGSYTTATAEDNYSLYLSTAKTGKYLRYNGGLYDSYIPSAEFGNRYDVIITPTGSHGMPSDDTWEEKEFTTRIDMCIGTTSPTATSSKFDGKIFGHFVICGRFNGIPCERESDNVLGYYDTYSKTFYEPIGSAPTSLGYKS